MKVLSLLTLTCTISIALLGCASGNAKQCHSCIQFSNITECDNQPPENCTEDKPLCIIQVERTGVPNIEILTKISITKGCATSEECSGESDSMWKPKKILQCCHSDLCNTLFNATSTEKTSDTSETSDAERRSPFLAVLLTLTLLSLHFLTM
ncbi:prostate stem cell antigen-like [Xenopus laevis]|uniref:Prostate stem cell antigen-like n=2 Tax=Xenopus laevis TaxID=8355 RepID=A0A1L8FLT4_XENLA|nr:prostate stem cell antigen-like [Xenopus laevis]OCT72539.1 hypothetical protein XELAEV_18035518mg [Xenopus laevis]